jgi:hypothetical protein
VLAFGTWLEPETAGEMERSVDALRARGVAFAMTMATFAGRIIEAKGQVYRRPRDPAAAGGQRDQAGTRRTRAPPPEALEDTAAPARLIEAVAAGVGAR